MKTFLVDAACVIVCASLAWALFSGSVKPVPQAKIIEERTEVDEATGKETRTIITTHGIVRMSNGAK